MPDESLLYHSQRLDFKWFMARAETRSPRTSGPLLAPPRRRRHARGHAAVDPQGSNERYAGVVEQLHDADATIVRIGKGSMGGKGRGFRFLNSMFYQNALPSLVPSVEFSLPRTLILATSVWDAFIEENELYALSTTARPVNEEISNAFLDARLPATSSTSCASTSTSPIGTPGSSPGCRWRCARRRCTRTPSRSPSPASTAYMLDDPSVTLLLDERVEELESAIKMVMASTYRRAAGNTPATQHLTEQEKMAVLVQEVCCSAQTEAETGRRHFYPTLSGVINALDFYLQPHTTPQDGCAQVALGMGNSWWTGWPRRASRDHPFGTEGHGGGGWARARA